MNDNGMFYVGADPRDPRSYLWLPKDAFRRHALITGPSGSGKSGFIEDGFLQRVVAGEGCLIIDPKGDTARDILAFISLLPEEEWPTLARDIVLVNPADNVVTASFNPLEVTAYASPSRQRADFLATLRRVFKFDDSRVSRLVLVLRRAVQLAMENELTIVDLPRLLTDSDFRDPLVRRSTDEDTKRFFDDIFPQGKANQQAWTASTLVRLEALLDDPSIKRFFGSRRSTFDFYDIMNTGKICIISLAKGEVGEESSRLLGGFLMGRLQLAAEARATLPSASRHPCTLFVEECQNYVSSSFTELLTEARAYGVSMVMVHQHLGQLPADLCQAALNNANVKIAFRLGAEDAATMAKYMFRADGQRVKQEWWNFASLGPLPIPYKERRFFSAGEEARQNRELFTQLPDRHMLVHVAGEAQPYHLRTVDLPYSEIARAGNRIDAFKRLIADVQRERLPEPSVTPIAIGGSRNGGTFEWRRELGRTAQR